MDIDSREQCGQVEGDGPDFRCFHRAVFERSRDAILISTGDSRIVEVNSSAAHLTGYSRDELLRMRTSDIREEIPCPGQGAFQDRIRAGENIQGESRILTRSGRKIDIEFNRYQVAISGVTYTCITARDITERNRMKSLLLQAEKTEALGMLARVIVHDFRNLLTIINGCAEIVLGKLSEDNDMRSDVEEISQAGQCASFVISQLSAFIQSRVRSPKTLNLQNVVKGTDSLIRRLIGEDIEFHVFSKSRPGLVCADENQIHQILINLVLNAGDAMPDGGKLTIAIGNAAIKEPDLPVPGIKPGQYVTLAVTDTGNGMDGETQSRIFDPFFTTKPDGKGMGLGLFSVHEAVKQSNGYLMVSSEPGKGTTFKIYFPRVANAATAENKPECGYNGSETILVVEDEASVRALACRILRDRGYNVIEAADGAEALSLAQQHAETIHLIMTDVVMPGINGSKLVSQLEAVRPGIKKLYISGHEDKVIALQGVSNSKGILLQKPFTVEGLARKVQEVIHS